MKKVVLLLALAGMTLAGCASNQYCLNHQKYESAKSIPPLHGTGNLQIPVSAGALQVPAVNAKHVPFGQKVQKSQGKTTVVCLDQPPAMPEQIRGNQIGQ